MSRMNMQTCSFQPAPLSKNANRASPDWLRARMADYAHAASHTAHLIRTLEREGL